MERRAPQFLGSDRLFYQGRDFKVWWKSSEKVASFPVSVRISVPTKFLSSKK